VIPHCWSTDILVAATLHVISGIDIALWDILGKVAGQPIHALLGGARKIRHAVYASDLAPSDPSPEAMLEQAQGHIAAGYRAMKFGWGSLGADPRSDARQIGRIRQAIGDGADIMVDMGFAVPLEDAIYLGNALAEHRVFFLEEPLSPDDLAGFARLTAVSPTPIATGEKESTQYPYIDLMDRGGLRIIQPDVARVLRMLYRYDFADEWIHEVVFEKRGEGEDGPEMIAGERACPPEDFGGSFQYMQAQAGEIEWAHPGYDPDVFDIASVDFEAKKTRKRK
jgi:hypothetical protein